MAQVTIELRHLLQMKDFNLFDFDYPISDPTWKEELERDIINYFYFHEIGSETPDRFKWQFRTRMLLIMPKYVELYDALQGVNPLATLQMVEESADRTTSTDRTTSSGSTTTSSTTNTQADDVRTDYPDHADIINDIPTEKTRSTTSNTTSTNNKNTAEADREGEIKREGELKREGYQGEVTDLVQNYYKNMKTINMMIIEELKDLFILVY